MNQPEFPTVFRGYDPAQVDHHLEAVQQAAESARQEAATGSVELTKLRQSHDALLRQLETERARAADLEQQARKVSSPTFADLGERIGAMLGLADEEATAIRQSATSQVDEHRRLAEEAAAHVRSEADRYAEDVRSRADVTATETVSRAKQEADSIIDDAAREAAARREEAEAYFEKQRATAAAQAADFERTLGDRRERSSAEFTAQMASQDQALAAVQERADLLAREAEEERAARAEESARLLESARSEATALVGSAKEQAERIRRDSERELAAATARRDSITAQLSNVRNMLGTLGGGAALGALVEATEPEAAPEGEDALSPDAGEPAAETEEPAEPTDETEEPTAETEEPAAETEEPTAETEEPTAEADEQAQHSPKGKNGRGEKAGARR